jgi:glutathione S-transferase
MTASYTLYGSYASYYTAKTRSYLRKKGIPFVERLPSDPAFREKIRPTSGSHRIPQLMTPQGDVLQDSVTIQDFLEVRFPDTPAIPNTPRQRAFTHLMELFGCEGLLGLAWMHRWVFEDNLKFVTMDFGRSFRPQGSDDELMKYGNIIAERMMSHGLPEATVELKAQIEEQYLSLLALFEHHFTSHPYLLGGQPSAADYAVMGALHAHLGRDPVGLHTMQQNAPRVFRWVEHMIVPEIQSPEFFDTEVVFAANDTVPETALKILEFIGVEFGEKLVLGALAFDQAMARSAPPPKTSLNSEQDQPVLPVETVSYNGTEHQVHASLYSVWLGQRAQLFFQGLPSDTQKLVADSLPLGPALELIKSPVVTPIERVNNRLFTG